MTYKEIRMPKVTEEDVIDVVSQFNHKFAKEHDDELTQLYDRVAKTEGERNEFIWISVLSLAGVAFLYLFWYGWLCKDVSSAVPDAKWGALFYILFTIGFVAGLVALALHVGSRMQNQELNMLYEKITKEYEKLGLTCCDETTPERFVRDLMWAWEDLVEAENDADFTERVSADDRKSLRRSIDKYVITEKFSLLDMVCGLKKFSDKYEYMCMKVGENSITFQGFRDGVAVDGVLFEFVPGKEYVGRASYGDFTFIDEVVAKIRMAYC